MIEPCLSMVGRVFRSIAITIVLTCVLLPAQSQTTITSTVAWLSGRRVSIVLPRGWMVAKRAPGSDWRDKEYVLYIKRRSAAREHLKGQVLAVSFFKWSD